MSSIRISEMSTFQGSMGLDMVIIIGILNCFIVVMSFL